MLAPVFRIVRGAERTAARPLERLVQSDGAVDAIIRAAALRRGAERRVERVLAAYLHLFNVPALSDVRRLSQQMAYLERRVRELSREPDEPEGHARPG